VPLIDQAARALDALSRRDEFTGPDDLVFCTAVGEHLNDDRLRERFYDALDAGTWRQAHRRQPIVFHEYADVRVMPMSLRRGCSERFLSLRGRHDQSVSRNARSVSVGW
jgi:hypothetical protein